MENSVTVTRDFIGILSTSFPSFWEAKTALARAQQVKGLDAFYAYIITEGANSHSQLFQDLFVDFVLEKSTGKRYLEFGATNGVELSNSFMLEAQRGWSGVLAEPDPQWMEALLKNRPGATIISDCIYVRSGDKLPFLSSANGVFSSLQEHAADDASGPLAGNAMARLREFTEVQVTTISLDDVFEKYFDGKSIEYMSVDTEGSEFEILSHFNFGKYHPSIVTVEHNFTDAQGKLDQLFAANGYLRIFSELTNFDAWYVLRELAQKRGLL